MILSERLLAVLACPVCRGGVRLAPDEIQCESCGRRYPVHAGVPRLLHPDSIFAAPAEPSAPDPAGPWQRLARCGEPTMTNWIDETIFKLLNESAPGALILNLGSGVGRFDGRIRPDLAMINLDVRDGARADVLADGHYLPFRDESLDGVFSNAVLEHVARPWVVADEIRRVLKPGGRAFINVPFLNVIHDTHDYFRFTDKALDVLFAGFEKIGAGVSSGGGSFLGPFLVEYTLCFVPGAVPKKIVRRAASWALAPAKYLDFMIRRSHHLRITADGFYFVGAKAAAP